MGRSAKKHRSKNNVVKLDRRVVLVIAVLGVAAVFAFLQTSSENYVPEVVGAPRLVVAQEHFDFGDVPLGQFVEAEFRVRNIGDQTLRLTDQPVVEVREGCCPPRAFVSTTAINPGDEATITLRFTMHEGMGGPHDFRIHLTTNDPQTPYRELVVLSNWV